MQTTTLNLTSLEDRAIALIIKECLLGCGGDTPQFLIDVDPYTFCNPSDLHQFGGMTKHQAAGVWSALAEKGLVFVNDTNSITGENEWCVSDHAIEYAEANWERLSKLNA